MARSVIADEMAEQLLARALTPMERALIANQVLWKMIRTLDPDMRMTFFADLTRITYGMLAGVLAEKVTLEVKVQYVPPPSVTGTPR